MVLKIVKQSNDINLLVSLIISMKRTDEKKVKNGKYTAIEFQNNPCGVISGSYGINLPNF